MTLKADGTNGILQQYDYQVSTTGFSYTFAAGTTVLVMNPAGTLATGTITMPASPVDGMTISFSSTQTITALTVNGNTGQSIVGAPTSLFAGAAATFVYRLSNTTWYTQTKGASNSPQIQPISASVASSALTISASALTLDFRSTSLTSGTVTTVTGTPANLVVPSTATLGTVNAVQSRLVVIALNNAGTIELAVVNISGGNNLDETTLLTTTAISASSTSASTVYSTTARTSVAFRVIGYIESTQATAGTWATAPSTIQGYGGQALSAMSSVGYSQTWQSVTRTSGTTYYNTTGKPIIVAGSWGASTAVCGAYLTVNGFVTSYANTNTANGAIWPCFALVPPGGSYVQTLSSMTANLVELR
jgi:hypothetical protein